MVEYATASKNKNHQSVQANLAGQNQKPKLQFEDNRSCQLSSFEDNRAHQLRSIEDHRTVDSSYNGLSRYSAVGPNMVQMVTANNIKIGFNFGDVANRSELQAKIGAAAFAKFRTADDAELTPLIAFFKNQPLPLVQIDAQCALLFPHCTDDAKLSAVKYALQLTNYNPIVAAPISVYLLKALAKDADSLVVAKSVLTEKANDVGQADTAMDEMYDNVDQVSGRTKFNADFLDATGKSGSLSANNVKGFKADNTQKVK
ncbi:MAG: hypothetical protein MJK04_21170, partial [Psychrosphaera sp.]|nr:hypothetical protein [Psychrosphaera sp.]